MRSLFFSTPLCALVFFAVSWSACAVSRSTETLRAGLAVHTFVREYTNAHLVVEGSRYFLVDAGLASEAERLDQDLRDEGFDPAKLKAIILTHGHADHAGGARYFQQKYGTKIIAGRDERMMAEGHNDKLCPTDSRARSRLAADRAATYTATTADQVIEVETSLAPLTDIEGRITPLPGHTAGALVVKVGDAVLVGDLFRGGIIGSSAEKHFYMCDLEDNRRDIEQLLQDIAPSAVLFFPGHFGPLKRHAVQALLNSWRP
jgi:hydroxyacylglutathione hydrolase